MSSYTEDLLSELKQSVAEDIAAEKAQLEAELAARAAAEDEAARQAEAARRAEIDARLEAERHRRRIASESRRAVVSDTDPSTAEAPVVPRHIERLAAPEATPTAQPQGHGAGFYFVVMGLPMLCLTAIAVAWILNAPPQPNLNPPAVAHEVTPPPGPVLEVVEPGAVAEVPDTPVSARVGAEDDAADDGEPAGDAKPKTEKKETAAQRKARQKRQAAARAARKAEQARIAAEKAKKEGNGGLTGTLFGDDDVDDIMKAK